jgi:hemoglobin
MDLQITQYHFGERPQVSKPGHEFYKVLGEDGIRKMVSDHYDLLRQSNISGLFATDDKEFESSKLNSSDFMIQICGGPDYYNQHRGKPMMANRHAPFAITPEARVVWLQCYKKVLMQLEIPEKLILSFWNYINAFSNWVVNTRSDNESPFKVIITPSDSPSHKKTKPRSGT